MKFIKGFIIYGLLFSSISNAYCQLVDCSNIGFEQGSTSGWKLTTGTVRLGVNSVIFENEVEAIFENGVNLVNQTEGNDPKISDTSIPVTSQGSRYSVRIGNINHGGRFDRIQTSFIVDPNHTIFLYKFAVFLQDFANHTKYQKPGFTIKVLDENGQSIACSEFDVQLGSTGSGALNGFKIQGDIQYLNWTTGAIDLNKYVGKKIFIIVTAYGCTNQRHFGYAYFDAECVKAEIKQLSKCPDKDGYMLLKAPDGFGTYDWQNGIKDQIAKIKVKVGDISQVKMLPLYSLQNTCELSLKHTVPYAKLDTTVNYSICEDDRVFIDNEAFNITGKYVRTINRSNVCDSTVTLNLKVSKIGRHAFSTKICEGENVKVGDSTYTKTGNYTTIIKRQSKCDSVVKSDILVDKKINVELGFDYKTINIGDSLELVSNIDLNDNNNIIWKPIEGLACPNCAATWAKPKQSGYYTINISNPNKTCFDADTLFIKVEPCQIHAPDIFTPNIDNQNNKFYILGGSCVKLIRSIAIYNRWGELVFKAENFPPSNPNYGWDGYYLGRQLESDVYAYKVIYELKEGKILDFKNAVTLVR